MDISGNAKITGDVLISGSARISGNAVLSGTVEVNGASVIKGYTKRSSGKISSGVLDEPDYEAIEKAKKDEADRIERDRLEAIRIKNEKDRLEREAATKKENERLAKEQRRQNGKERIEQIKRNMISWGEHVDDSYEKARGGKVKRAKHWGDDTFMIQFDNSNNCIFKIEYTGGEDKGSVLNFNFSKNSNNKERLKSEKTVQINGMSLWIESEFQVVRGVSGQAATIDIFQGDTSTTGRKENPEDVKSRADDLRFFTAYCQEFEVLK